MKRLPKISPGLLAGLVLGAAIGAGAFYVASGGPVTLRASRGGATQGAAEEHGEHEEGEHGEEEPGVVHFPKEKWKAAGLEVAPAQRGEMTVVHAVTGKVTADEDQLAHIFPLVEGIVREVPVRYGDRVEAGAPLVIIDSKEVGQDKLALVQSRLEVKIARVNLDWKQTIYDNTQELIKVLTEESPNPQTLGERFQDRPMGTYRGQLVGSYARLHQARAEYERDKNLYERQVVSEQQYLRTKAVYEAAQATYNAQLEQIDFTSEQELIIARQQLEQAQVAEKSNVATLIILGYGQDEVASMDPLAEKSQVSFYAIEAPFAGTITAKDVVLEERVGTTTKLLDLTNLSDVWVQADIYEKDLPLLASLRGRTIRFRVEAYPERTFDAEVFYTGDIVDPATRTVRMMAETDNPDRLLKPGQFVTIELPAGTESGVLQVPASAVVEDRQETFVFVHQGGEEFERRDVTIGRRVPEQVAEITAGLEAGEPVAVAGTFALKTELQGLGEEGHAH